MQEYNKAKENIYIAIKVVLKLKIDGIYRVIGKHMIIETIINSRFIT